MTSVRLPLHRHARKRRACSAGRPPGGTGAGPSRLHRGGGEEAPGRPGKAPPKGEIEVQWPPFGRQRGHAAAAQVPQLPVQPRGRQEGANEEACRGRRGSLAGHQDHIDQGQGAPQQQQWQRHQTEIVQVPSQEDVCLPWRLCTGAKLKGSHGIKNGEGIMRVRLLVLALHSSCSYLYCQLSCPLNFNSLAGSSFEQ
jgi:hypothetical protein